MSQLTVSDIGERALIQRITARLATPRWVVIGPGDDAAIIEPERGALDVFTTDAQVEGVHFDRRFVPPDAIGHRALAVNLSDVAAMGARPRAALLSLALPDDLAVDVVDEMIGGMVALADAHGVALVGGNVTRTTGPMVIDVTAIGAVRRRRVLTRSGARPGDELFVTGTVGDAAVGLRMLREKADAPGPIIVEEVCERRYQRPEPRVRVGGLLGRNRAASSLIDLSDGLVDGVRQIADASNVGLALDVRRLPISETSRRWHEARGLDPVETALAGGDDYELLFTVRPSQRGRLATVRAQAGTLPITRIGVVTSERDIVLNDEAGRRALPAGFEHFR